MLCEGVQDSRAKEQQKNEPLIKCKRYTVKNLTEQNVHVEKTPAAAATATVIAEYAHKKKPKHKNIVREKKRHTKKNYDENIHSLEAARPCFGYSFSWVYIINQPLLVRRATAKDATIMAHYIIRYTDITDTHTHSKYTFNHYV